MIGKKRLSLCIITKNDEKYLSNCLQNTKEFVDEIIIVDIGSRDLTIAIGKQAGANVYRMEWKNNYSEAKNLCLGQAKGRWILFLQANERISKEQLKEVHHLLDNPNVEGYLLYVDRSSQNHRISSPVQSLRLFRNRREYRYQYKAFEQIPDECLSNIQDAGIRITQQIDPILAREVDWRTLLLEEDIKEYPEDSYLQYMYGIELLNQKKYKESIIYFQQACKNVNFDYLFAPHLYKCLSWALISLQRHTEALDVLDEGIKEFPFYSDLLVLRGELRKQSQQYGEAIQDLEKSLKIRKQPNSIVPRAEINVSIILETLGEVHEKVLNHQQALACYRQAYELNKRNQELLYKIGKLVKKTDSTEVLKKLLKVAMEQKNLQQLVTLMDIFFQQRKYVQVLAHSKHLESLIGKGEQIESIKFSCYMMLGKVEEAGLCFSAINKESPFYNHMLLQRIENYWCHNQWKEAEELLEEINEIGSMENSIKAAYHSLHRLFTEKELCYTLLTKQEYEIVSTLMENFLWLGHIEKAQLLLSLLLQEEKEDQYIKLAEPWIEGNHYENIKKTFLCISNQQKQLEFKQEIIESLLRSEYIETAEKLVKLGDSQSLGALEYVLWSKGFIKKIKEWIGKIHSSTLQTPTKPSKALVDFYQGLGLAKNDVNFTIEEMTCAKIHEEIGKFYVKAQQREEALSAYFRALQWDPLDDLAQEKVVEMFQKNPSQFHIFLEEKCWILEGGWFHHKQEFIHYVQGLIQFKNQLFEKALAAFLKIGEDKSSYPIAFAYMIGSLWLAGREVEAKRQLKEQSKTSGVFPLFFHVCKNYVLDRLDEGHRQYPYSELIMLEKQRIRDSCYE